MGDLIFGNKVIEEGVMFYYLGWDEVGIEWGGGAIRGNEVRGVLGVSTLFGVKR